MLRKGKKISTGLSGSKKSPEVPASRKPNIEGALCDAIQKRLVVELRYENETGFREFEPSAVYFTTRGKVCVSGLETRDDNPGTEPLGPHNFEVGRIADLRITNRQFIPDPRFDRRNPKYRNGILCSI